MNITPEQVDRIGGLKDKADNYLAALTLPLRAATHVEGCKAGLEEIRDECVALYHELGGSELATEIGDEATDG